MLCCILWHLVLILQAMCLSPTLHMLDACPTLQVWLPSVRSSIPGRLSLSCPTSCANSYACRQVARRGPAARCDTGVSPTTCPCFEAQRRHGQTVVLTHSCTGFQACSWVNACRPRAWRCLPTARVMMCTDGWWSYPWIRPHHWARYGAGMTFA